MEIKEELIRWYRANKRDLPWRKTNNPYFVWLSEIILQQTRVSQGLPYYESFTVKFPTVFDLAAAHQDDVIRTWQGLGYYSRAQNLHNTAKLVSNELNGKFPKDYQNLLKLKGVGEYTAAAIASFCFNESVAVVDGNVYRVLSRLFDLDTPIDQNAGKKEFRTLAEELLDKQNAAEYNQAIMEFGALQCTPKNPHCDTCPLTNKCLAFDRKTIPQRPVKSSKTKMLEQKMNFLFVTDGQNCVVEKRDGKGIWKNLYQFPLLENTGQKQMTTFIEKTFSTRNIINLSRGKAYKHLLSHRKLHIVFWEAEIAPFPETLVLDKYKIIPLEQLDQIGMPRVITRYLEEKVFEVRKNM
ncbi:MAG: A/G-specific adenine glycosylase [Flavobacteriales bacterium]